MLIFNFFECNETKLKMVILLNWFSLFHSLFWYYFYRIISKGCRLVGCGSAVPSLQISNDDLAKIVETSDEWISVRTGIHNRRVLSGQRFLVLLINAGKFNLWTMQNCFAFPELYLRLTVTIFRLPMLGLGLGKFLYVLSFLGK